MQGEVISFFPNYSLDGGHLTPVLSSKVDWTVRNITPQLSTGSQAVSTMVGQAPYSKQKNVWYIELQISWSYFNLTFLHYHSYLTAFKPCKRDRETHEMQGFNKCASLGEAESGISEQ